MNKFVAVVCMSMLAAPVLLAADAKPAAVPVKTNPGEAAPAEAKNKPLDATVILKNKSEFKMDAATRNPFWPIGYKPAGKVATGGSEQGEVPPGAFVVSSITLDGTAKFAIINGKPMGEGQQFGLQVGTQVYQVSVKRIEDGRVILGRRDEEIAVPLRRK